MWIRDFRERRGPFFRVAILADRACNRDLSLRTRVVKRVIRGRIESTPSEQLVALRKARDRYVALADHLKDSSGTVTTRLEDRQRERDARRIARAYDKSITNMAAKMVRAGAASRTATLINNLGMARPIFAVAVSVLALVVLVYPGHFEKLRASIKTPTPLPIASPPLMSQPQINSAVLAPKMDPKAGKSFAPSGASRSPATLRPTAIAEPARPLARQAPPMRSPAKPKADADAGFVAKVLQPDGTFKEEHFASAPH